MKVAAIIVAGGQGTRAGGGLPKQLQHLSLKPVFQWSLDACASSVDIEQTVLVVPEGDAKLYSNDESHLTICFGGVTRSASVRAGLEACDLDEDDIVLVHDAARPGLNHEAISALVSALSGADAAAPALPVADALKRRAGETFKNVERTELYRVQTPQAFRVGMIKQALSGEGDFVDDLAAIEAIGGKIKLIPGEERLSKITYPEDFERLERLLMPLSPVRVGTGFDVHAFESGEHVTLCGVQIPHHQKLSGHSDADVAWHALTDAILGAAALGDIGDHFPPTDPQWSGADSAIFLKAAIDLAGEVGFALSSCDLTVICEAPKVKPHREAMRARTAEITGLPVSAISVKATTTEGLGFTGRGEGIAAQASAVLSPIARAG